MTEESIIDQVMSEKTEAEDGDEKANSIEELTIRKGPHKVVSRYLSGPKGSCHDACKYGTEHAIQAKPWKTTKKEVASREKEIEVLEEDVTHFARNKKSGSSSRPITSVKDSTPSEEKDVLMELNNSDIRQAQSDTSSISVQQGSKNQTKREIVKNKCGFGSSSRKETATDIRGKQMTILTGGKEKSKPPSNPLSPKHSAKKPSCSSSKTAKNLTEKSSMKNNEIVIVEEAKSEEVESNENLLPKILNVIEPTNAYSFEEPTQAHDGRKLASPPPSSSRDKSLRHNIKKTSKSGVSALSSRKGLRHGTSSNVSNISLGDKGKRNMLHKTGSASGPPSVRSSISSSKSSLGKQSVPTSKLVKTGLKTGSTSRSPSVLSCISSTVGFRGKQNVTTPYKSNRKGNGSQGENLKVGYKIRPKLSTIVGAANKVVSARRLNFRKREVIELQQQINDIPRRLKFRPVRLLGDDYQKDANGTKRRTITSKEGNNSESNATSNKPGKVVYKHQNVEGSKRRITVRKIGGERSKVDGSTSGAEKVVLRHQIVVGKKVNPRLYNNVIEETASMLAELRNSKVKALVGAFETVISLDSPRAGATPSK
ncbi:hypothetical protein Lal_00040938 [Lupinus albus]|uniref:Putative Calmodulin-binding domain, plant n=1 Tax=Lupinus albus TaxID=3870 RepID=A0A6A4PKD4_LUPAL|nr:putative Calmodulin-binding domain, plant [Lupinus albus]KAF1887336.1 hypothetical protein Lal_00040938 [Lupinus albus]